MPANVDALVQEGIAALKSGRKEDAHKALMKAVELDEQNEQAWLWLSGVVDTAEERQICLENVLALNPNNAKAAKGLQETLNELSKKLPPKPAPAAFDPFDGTFDASSPFAGTGFEANPYGAASSNDPALSGWSGFDAPATSVDWGRPDNQPPSGRSALQPSEEEYDNWMAGLSIGASSATNSVPAFETTDFDPSAGPFGSSSMFGDDDLGNDPFSASAKSPFAADPSPFNSHGAAVAEPSANPFGDFSMDEPEADAPANDPFGGAPNSGGSPFTFDDSPAMSDPFASGLGAGASSGGGSSVFSFPPAAAAQPKKSAFSAFDSDSLRIKDNGPPSGGTVFTTIDSTPSMANPAIYFQQIPDDIQVGGISGGSASPVLIATVIILTVLNIGSLLLLLSNLH